MKKYIAVILLLVLVLIACSLLLLRRELEFAYSEVNIQRLITQLEGRQCYWHELGGSNYLDRFMVRHYNIQCKIEAAKLLQKYSNGSNEVIDALMQALKDNPTDVDTGDGILPVHSTIQAALETLQ